MEYPDGFLDSHKRRGICGVLAVAMAADVSFDVAKATLRDCMRDLYPQRQRFRGGTHYSQVLLALKRLGVRYVEHPEFAAMNISIGEFTYIVDPAKKYLVYVPRHVVTVHNRLIADQGNIAAPIFHWAHRRIINRPVIEILGRGWGENA